MKSKDFHRRLFTMVLETILEGSKPRSNDFNGTLVNNPTNIYAGVLTERLLLPMALTR